LPVTSKKLETIDMRFRPTVLASAFAMTIAIASLPQTAHAQTAEQQAACQNDAYRFCQQYIPDHNRIASCLRRNIRYISRACRAQFYRSRRRGRRH
jgi:type II secretory pathway component PulL